MGFTQPNQDVMHTIADATGGRVYINSSAIGESVRRAIDDSRISYVLGYCSPRAVPDGRFHDISVKVNRSGVDVRHRKGYLSLATAERARRKVFQDQGNDRQPDGRWGARSTMREDGVTLSSAYKLRPDAYRLHVVVSDVASQTIGSLVLPIPAK